MEKLIQNVEAALRAAASGCWVAPGWRRQARDGPMRVVLVLLLLVLAAPARADFDAGCEAFDRGDFAAAREEWRPLAEAGHAKAQFRLGCLYVFGQGVREDPEKAVALFRRAAEQGDADAQNNLGGMYAEGLGVERDLTRAYMWFELAAGAGHEMAKKNRAYVAAEMSPDDVARARAMAAERQGGS